MANIIFVTFNKMVYIYYVHSVYVFRSMDFVLVDMIHYPLTKHRGENLDKVKIILNLSQDINL